jgi:hypothetical protein
MITTEEYRGHTIGLDYAIDAESPREWDNIFTMTCWHRRYNLGDHQSDDAEMFRVRRMKHARPLYLYDHSGITISLTPFNDQWDSGQVGFIYATTKTLRKNLGYNYTDAQVQAAMESEVKTYDQWLRGEVYCYYISRDGVSRDSCCGFYGDDYTMDEARAAVDYMAGEDRKQHQEQVKTYIRHHVPLERRA